jgi:hypothetical protein
MAQPCSSSYVIWAKLIASSNAPREKFMPAAALIRKLEQFNRTSHAERQFLEQTAVRQKAVAKGEDLVREGVRILKCTWRTADARADQEIVLHTRQMIPDRLLRAGA